MKTQISIKKICDNIIKNKEGITLNFNGNIPKLKGYAVSITNNKPLLNSNKELKQSILNLIKLSNRLNLNGYIGSWIDKTNKVFIDLTLNVNDKNEALNIGKAFNQQAIFSFNSKEVISIN